MVLIIVAVINHRKLALDRRSDLSEVRQLRPRGGGCGQGGTRVGVNWLWAMDDDFIWILQLILPSGYVKIAIENGHRNSGFSH